MYTRMSLVNCLRIYLFMILLSVALAHSQVDQKAEPALFTDLSIGNTSTSFIHQQHEVLRRKRGIGSVLGLLFKTGKIVGKTIASSKAWQVASISYTLTNAASEGCLFYQRICRNKNDIQALEKEHEKLVKYIISVRKNHQNTYSLLDKVALNNKMINHSLTKMTEQIQELEIIDRDFLKAMIKNQIMNKTVLRLKFQVTEELKFQTVNELVQKKAIDSTIQGWTQIGVLLASKAYSAAKKKIYEHFFSRDASLSNKKTNSFSRRLTKFQNFQQRTTDRTNKLFNKRGFLRSFRRGVNKVVKLGKLIGIASSAAMIAMEHKNWKALDQRLEEAKQGLKKEVASLKEEVMNLRQVIVPNLTNLLTDEIQSYNNASYELLTAFNVSNIEKKLLQHLTGKNTLGEVPNWKSSSETTILKNQEQVLDFLDETTYTLDEITKLGKTTKVMAEIIQEGTAENDLVSSMYQKTLRMVSYSIGQDTQEAISLPLVVCIISLQNPDLPSYRTYPLNDFKKECLHDHLKTFSSKYLKNRYDLTINFLIKDFVFQYDKEINAAQVNMCDPGLYFSSCKGDILEIHQNIVNFIREDSLLSKDTVPNIKEIICRLKSLYPERKTFLHIDLSLFHDSCSSFPEQYFNKLVLKANEDKLQCFKAESKRIYASCIEKTTSGNLEPVTLRTNEPVTFYQKMMQPSRITLLQRNNGHRMHAWFWLHLIIFTIVSVIR